MPPLDLGLCADVVRLDKEGMKWRAIARALKISRNTVRRIITEHREAREQPHSALPVQRRTARPSKLDPLRPRVEEVLQTYPDITAQRVFEILREKESYSGGYTIVKLLVRKLRPKPKAKPSLETPPRVPGRMGECDWSPYPVDFTHAPPMTVQAFGYTLRYPNLTSVSTPRSRGGRLLASRSGRLLQSAPGQPEAGGPALGG